MLHTVYELHGEPTIFTRVKAQIHEKSLTEWHPFVLAVYYLFVIYFNLNFSRSNKFRYGENDSKTLEK